MKLLHLWLESAAEEAKRRGYTARPYGKWEYNGKIVARTQDDELVPVKDDENGGDDKDDPKPTGMSAQTAGTKPSNTVTKQDAEKLAGSSDSESDPTSSSDVPQQPVVVPNPNRLQLDFGVPTDKADVANKLGVNPNHPLLAEGVVGEEVYVCSNAEAWAFFRGDTGRMTELSPAEVERMASEDAAVQHKTWRASLDKDTRKKLLESQFEWQVMFEDGNRDDSFFRSQERERINKFVNTLPPTEINSSCAIERGMSIDPHKIKSFLEDIRIGEVIESPPSGYSTNAGLARSFAEGYMPNKISVVMRLMPKDGKINGIHLHGLNDENIQLFDRDSWDMLSRIQEYDVETEILRPSGPKSTCVGVKKLLYNLRNNRTGNEELKAMYIIDLQEEGYPQKINEDIGQPESPSSIFEKIMNSSFGSWNPKRRRKENSSKLTDIVNGVLP